MKYYTGIGSRDTPEKFRMIMRNTAEFLEEKGYILRSGGARGADSFFEEGASPAARKIYLPYDGFEKKYENGKDYVIPEYNDYYTKKLHPKPNSLSEKGRLFMARNAYQVLGDDLKTNTNFILCWTPNGDIRGGTAQAIRIAKLYRIPVFNFATQMQEIKYYLNNFI